MAATALRMLLTERCWDRANANIVDPSPFEQSAALADRGLERVPRLHEAWNGKAEGRIRVGVSAWAPDMCSPELLRKLGDLRAKLDTICTSHLNQIWGEVAAVQAQRGRLPTEYLDDVGFLQEALGPQGK